MKMAMRTKLRVWLGVMLSVVLLATSALAQVATNYSSNKRTLKVGILLLDSTIDADLDGSISPGEAARGPENPDPFIFYIADSRNDLKPQNWEFINPLSPKIVTADVAARWAARTAGVGQQYQVGQQVVKKMAAYWEVPLTDTPIQDLLQFDLLFITNHRVTRLTSADREKLRKLVDAGGVLWLEDCGGMRMDGAGPLFLDQLQFSGGRGEATSGVAFPIVNVPNHPILSTPNPLSLQEVANLGDKNYANYALTSLFDANMPPNPEVLVNVVGNNARGGLPYIAAGNYGAGRVIATAGDSGCDINDYIGGVRTSSGGNSGAYCGANLEVAHAEDLKFLYNVVAWGSSNSQYRKDPRRTGASFESVGNSLVPAFQVSGADGMSSTTSPLISKGVVYSTGVDTAGNAWVRAFAAHPSLVVGDRGLPDLALGKPYDELWRWSGMGGMPSSPVQGTVYGGGGGPSAGGIRAAYGDFLFVTLSDGTLVKLTSLNTDTQGNILPAPIVQVNAPVAAGTYQAPPGWPNGPSTFPAPAPIVHDGKVYIVEFNGRVRCVNALTMQTLWWSFDADQDPVYRPTGSPTLGYSRLAITNNAQTSGGDPTSRQTGLAANASGNSNDLMLYVPVWFEDTNTGTLTHRMMAYWLGARHEVVLTDSPQGSGNFRPRSALSNRQYTALNPGYPGPPPAGYPYIRPVVRVYRNRYVAGNLIATAQDEMAAGNATNVFTARFVDAQGLVRVEDSMGNGPTRGVVGPGSTPDNVIISVDYDVFYVSPGQVPPGLVNPNTNAARGRIDMLGFEAGGEGIAMTPEDILFSATKSKNPRAAAALPITMLSGDYEQYGLTRLRQSLSLFELTGGLSVAEVQIGNATVLERPTLTNRIRFNQFLNESVTHSGVLMPGYESLSNITPVGTPVATNDGIIYQVLRATSPTGGAGGATIPVTVVAALDMKKEVIINLPETYNPSYRVLVQQLDATSYDPTGATPPQPVTATLPAVANTQTTGSTISSSANLTGDASRGRIVVTDMRANGRRFSSSLSFVVTYVPAGGTGDKTVVVTPTPLLPFTGAENDIETRGLVNGGYSPLLWYYVLPGEPTSSLTLTGDMLYLGIRDTDAKVVALDADPASNDPGVRSGLGLQVEAVATFAGTPKINHVRWVRRTDAPVIGAPVGSQGTLAVNTTNGTLGSVAAFEGNITLITDSKRIIEVDGDGAASWTLDGTIRYQTAGGAIQPFDPTVPPDPNLFTGRIVVERKTLSRPSLARRISASDYLICDTGNNRIVRVDRSGKVHWELDDLNDLFGILASADAKVLSGPTDVQFFTVLTPDPAGGSNPPIGYEIHYLIADAGNNRIIEVADYYDRDGQVRNIATPERPTARRTSCGLDQPDPRKRGAAPCGSRVSSGFSPLAIFVWARTRPSTATQPFWRPSETQAPRASRVEILAATLPEARSSTWCTTRSISRFLCLMQEP